MVTTCCVEGCSNNSKSVENNSTVISFHAFPTKLELRQKWLRAIGRPYWNPPSHARICSAHFDVHEINHEGSKVQIKGEVCPGGKLPLTTAFSASDVRVCRLCLASDVRLFSLEHGQLKVCMEVLTELNDKSHTAFDLPQFVCFECGSQLLKYNRLIEKSLIAQATLLDIFADHGRITKRLIQQENRRALNLHSSLSYSEPAPVITINHSEVDVSLEEPSKSNDFSEETNFCVFQHQIKKTTGHNQDPIKKQNTERKRLSQSDPKHTIATNESNLTVKLEEESDAGSVHFDFDNLDLKTDDISYSECSEDDTKQNLNRPTKEGENIEVKVSELEKKDSGSHEIKRAVKAPKRKLATKPKSTAYCNVKKIDDGDLQAILDEMDKVLESSDESDDDSYDAAVNPEDFSDSSEGECLQTLKEKAKIKKMADNYFAKLDKKLEKSIKTTMKTSKKTKTIIPKITLSEKRMITRHQKAFEEALQKLKLFNIEDLTLEEQIEAWKADNEQPVQTSHYECEICTRKFVRKRAYEKHLPRHGAARGEFECKVCKERFRHLSRLRSHSARTHEKKYGCTMCTKVLYTFDKAHRHDVLHSGQVYACPHCAFSTTRRSTAWEHVRAQHEHAHHCTRCGHIFINAKGLATHVSMTHQGEPSEPQDPRKCEECNIVFHSEGALNVHHLVAKQHKGKNIRPGGNLVKTCKRCGEQFPLTTDLARHMRVKHNCYMYRKASDSDQGAYPQPCEYCGKELASRFEHWCHVRREHREHRHAYRSRVVAMCATCGKGFQNKTKLHQHELRHRGPASLACAQCPRKFYDEYALNKHALVHMPDRPFACEICHRAFKVKGNMERHRRMHTGETPYACKYCGKKFRYWESLSLHEKHMHQKVPWPARDRTRRRAQPKDGTAED